MKGIAGNGSGRVWPQDNGSFSRVAIASTLSIVLSLISLYFSVKLTLPSLATLARLIWLLAIAFHIFVALEQQRFTTELKRFLRDRWGTADIEELRSLRLKARQMSKGVIWAWVIVMLITSVIFAIRYAYQIPELISVFAIHMVVSAAQTTNHIATRKSIRCEIERVRNMQPACRMAV
ncbi:hypothetical protein [Lysobacter sp. CA199]|uniref:hypothetical protein n=1 Tax=Lysobacter sp. CA199 TaxID=3455608 RepID=UPI003F8D83E0